MNSKEFYNNAVKAAKEKGHKNPRICTITGCYYGDIKHSCSLWIGEKQKNINSGQHSNHFDAISAFKDAIDFDNKTYSTNTQNIEL